MMEAAGTPGAPRVNIRTVLLEWTRLGCIGFGGPPAHVALLRRLCVDDRRWIDGRTFEDANAACGLLPGPASTQLAIFCAHRVGGPACAIVGGLAFVLPGLGLLIALAALSLQDAPPDWVRGASAGAGAAVVAVVAQAGTALVGPSLRAVRPLLYVVLAGAATLLVGPYVVLVRARTRWRGPFSTAPDQRRSARSSARRSCCSTAFRRRGSSPCSPWQRYCCSSRGSASSSCCSVPPPWARCSRSRALLRRERAGTRRRTCLAARSACGFALRAIGAHGGSPRPRSSARR